MAPVLHAAVGLAPALCGWELLRRAAGTREAGVAALALDLAPVIAGWSVILGATARPGFAGLVILVLCCGLAIADRTKRAVLREPVVFSDMFELLQVFAYPALYLALAPRRLVCGWAIAAIAGATVLLWLEPPIWAATAWSGVPGYGLLLAGVFLLSRPPLLTRAAAAFRCFKPSGDPVQDARRFGLLATLLIHGMIARVERAERGIRIRPLAAPVLAPGRNASLPPILVVQSESFFDARRLHAGIATQLLPSFDRLRRSAVASGRLAVPGWGANTMRTEFAVLTGFDEKALGFDRFNPYRAFARAPVASMAWQLRQAGYRTIAVHPFARRFYRRDRVLQNLGFDSFLGIEAFASADHANGFVSDQSLARLLLGLIEPGCFLFAISMENHGPWLTDSVHHTGFEVAPGLPRSRSVRALRRYLAGLKSADEMLATLSEALAEQSRRGVLAFYGDHLPTLPESFGYFGYADTNTDYLVWQPDGGRGQCRDLPVHALSGLILETAMHARTLP